MRTIKVATHSGEYGVSIGSGLLASLPRRLSVSSGPSRRGIFVLTSPGDLVPVGKVLDRRIFLGTAYRAVSSRGERHKRLSQVERLGAEMVGAGADRSSLLIAFGGGIVGDVGGFLAAIYMRGIDYIQVPTTLLAQVDSSIGGKTGVNLSAGKNLMGCFYHPQAVFADIDLLRTLPERELRAGLYESIKAGLIRDAALFRFIEANLKRIDRRDVKVLENIIAASIRMKAAVVGLDEKETGIRMILNFGHTIGHAIEAAGGFGTLLHGEAVAWGMLVALEISRARKLLTDENARRIGRVIRYFDPPALPPLRGKHLLQAAAKDKKNRAGVRRFVLLKRLGEAIVVDDVTDAELLSALGSTLSGAARA